jgi:hypothetical protein
MRPLVLKHLCPRMGFGGRLHMHRIAINFDDHRNAGVDDEKIWLKSSVALSTSYENWERSKGNTVGLQVAVQMNFRLGSKKQSIHGQWRDVIRAYSTLIRNLISGEPTRGLLAPLRIFDNRRNNLHFGQVIVLELIQEKLRFVANGLLD